MHSHSVRIKVTLKSIIGLHHTFHHSPENATKKDFADALPVQLLLGLVPFLLSSSQPLLQCISAC